MTHNSRRDINLGSSQLEEAVRVLGRGCAAPPDRAHHLLVLIAIICESVRFITISDHIATFDNWWRGAALEPTMLELENNWSLISRGVLNQNATRYGPLGISELNNNPRDVCGVLLCRIAEASHSRHPTMATTGPYPFILPKGRELVEVYWLRVDKIDSRYPGAPYGTITAEDSLGRQCIYNVVKREAKLASPKDFLLLNGPSQGSTSSPRAISGADSFALTADLKSWALGFDDQLALGAIHWNPYSITDKYNRAVTHQIRGTRSAVSLNFIVLSDAAQAEIKIDLINGDGEDPAEVYGWINAYNGHGSTQLFYKPEPSDHIEVRPRRPIPLTRSVVAVPMAGALTIQGSLMDYDPESFDDEITDQNNFAIFEPDIGHSSQQTIKGKRGEILVKVTWS
ncbi:hypothetical protein F4777DRAFT_542296 [Nemania sp. FL0916]|nr:hypothetical protein F4777DRAFT_542296 [Nemania sp. FL0916]